MPTAANIQATTTLLTGAVTRATPSLPQGVLPLDRTMAELYSEVNWRKLNTEYRHNYAASLAETEAVRNIDPEGPVKAARKVMEKLENLPVKIKRNRTAVIENA